MTPRVIVFLALICCQSMVWSQEAARPPKPGVTGSAGEPIEEIEVRAARAQMRELRQEIDKLEDKFYDEYNRRNTDERYDIVCNVEATTGSNLRTRVCRPQFVNDANAAEASALMGGEPAEPAYLVAEEQVPDFKKNVLEVTSNSPDLRRLLKERNEAETRYNALRARTSGQDAKQLKQPEQAKQPQPRVTPASAPVPSGR